MEKDTILSFLQTFKTVHNLGATGISPSDNDYSVDCEYESEIELAWRTSHAGRSFVDVDDDRSVPLSLWPTVLYYQGLVQNLAQESIYSCKKRKLNATGLYYLLREGPALIDRADLGSRTNRYDEVIDSDVDVNNDASLSNDNKPEKEKNLLNRKCP